MTVLEERVATSRAAADEATARLLRGMGVGTPGAVERAANARERAIDQAHRDLEPLAVQGTVTGEQAIQLLLALDDFAAGAVSEAEQLDLLYYEAGSWEGLGAQADPDVATPLHSLGNLAALDQTVTYSLLESASARYASDPTAFDASDAVGEFLLGYSEVVAREGGYFGPDAASPLQNGYIPVEVALVHEADAVGQAGQVIADVGLWADDEWIRGWPQNQASAPTSFEVYRGRSDTATSLVRRIIDDRLAERVAGLIAARDRSERVRDVFYSIALVLALAAVSVLLWSLHTVLQRGRLIAIDGAIDPLTGLGNRKRLETEVIPNLNDPALNHHVMVTLDMDRFKFVNDLHGHVFGDRVLEVIGTGLMAVANHVEGVEGSAVRLGGDEFLVSFHSATKIPVDRLHRVIQRLRSTLLSADDGTLVRCAFSYGLVEAEGSPDLRSLMAASDLAAYEDKSRDSDS